MCLGIQSTIIYTCKYFIFHISYETATGIADHINRFKHVQLSAK